MFALIIFLVIAVPTVGGFLMIRAKMRSVKRQEADAQGKVLERLNLVPKEVGGRIVDGPALETPGGKLEVYASKAPRSNVIDVTKFSAPVTGDLQLIVVRVEDAAKVPARGLQPVALADPELAAAYKVLASDPEACARLFTVDTARKFQSVEGAARGKARLRVVHGTATVTLARGLAQAGELRDFVNGCAAIMDDLRKV